MKSLVVSLLFLSCALFVFASDSNDEAAAKLIPPPLPPRPQPNIYLPGIVISTNSFTLGVRYCYCFSFKCKVPGMYNGFKGWFINNQKGYYVVNGKLYIIYRCDQKGY